MTVLNLPYPPTVNNLFRNAGRGRVKTARYIAWSHQAALSIMVQRPKPVHGPFRLTIIATRPDRRRRDISNLTKATEDALVANGLIEDDHLAESIYLAWSSEPPRKDATVRVEIVSVADEQRAAA